MGSKFQHGCDTFGDAFEVPVIAGTFQDVDHVDLPRRVIRGEIRCMPFYAVFIGINRVDIFDLFDCRVFGDSGYCGKTYGRG